MALPLMFLGSVARSTLFSGTAWHLQLTSGNYRVIRDTLIRRMQAVFDTCRNCCLRYKVYALSYE